MFLLLYFATELQYTSFLNCSQKGVPFQFRIYSRIIDMQSYVQRSFNGFKHLTIPPTQFRLIQLIWIHPLHITFSATHQTRTYRNRIRNKLKFDKTPLVRFLKNRTTRVIAASTAGLLGATLTVVKIMESWTSKKVYEQMLENQQSTVH